MSGTNPYDDRERASAYAGLSIENTYHLAYRDLPRLLSAHCPAGTALDYGCGTGRSTRFLRDHGFSAIGVDVSEPMIAQAREQDPGGDYRLISPGVLRDFPDETFDLALSVMPFDSIASAQAKTDTLLEIARVLKPRGCKILVASSRELYIHEWVSFSTEAFPGNRSARSGDAVRVIVKEFGDRRAVEDILWTEDAYRDTFRQTPLHLVETLRPLASPDDPYLCAWLSELAHAPWVVFVLRKA